MAQRAAGGVAAGGEAAGGQHGVDVAALEAAESLEEAPLQRLLMVGAGEDQAVRPDGVEGEAGVALLGGGEAGEAGGPVELDEICRQSGGGGEAEREGGDAVDHQGDGGFAEERSGLGKAVGVGGGFDQADLDADCGTVGAKGGEEVGEGGAGDAGGSEVEVEWRAGCRVERAMAVDFAGEGGQHPLLQPGGEVADHEGVGLHRLAAGLGLEGGLGVGDFAEERLDADPAAAADQHCGLAVQQVRQEAGLGSGQRDGELGLGDRMVERGEAAIGEAFSGVGEQAFAGIGQRPDADGGNGLAALGAQETGEEGGEGLAAAGGPRGHRGAQAGGGAEQHEVAIAEREDLAAMALGGVVEQGAGDAAMVWLGGGAIAEMHHQRRPAWRGAAAGGLQELAFAWCVVRRVAVQGGRQRGSANPGVHARRPVWAGFSGGRAIFILFSADPPRSGSRAGRIAALGCPQMVTDPLPAASSPTGPDYDGADFPGWLPPGVRVYAIGDVHGCDDRLAAMHAIIVDDLAAHPVANPLVIHLGDYIDRGPDSAAVLERIARPIDRAPGLKVANLMGNHEDMLLTALGGGRREEATHWLRNGGGETLMAWGLSWRDPPASWEAGIPPRQLGTMRGLSIAQRIGTYVFVHAGLRPGVALHSQTREDMLWIREPFLSFDGARECVVVHGHTPAHEPTVRRHRIGIDTGAVLGGDLTCAVLEGGDVAFLRS